MSNDRDSLLQVGYVLLGIGLLVSSRVAEAARRSRLLAEPPPVVGAVPGERHQHL